MWSSKSLAQIPTRHSTQTRSPTLVWRVHSTQLRPTGASMQAGFEAQLAGHPAHDSQRMQLLVGCSLRVQFPPAGVKVS
jgi:hypothetical protein